jgi:hypothetical protein
VNVIFQHRRMRGILDELKKLIVTALYQNLLNMLNRVSNATSKYYPRCVSCFNLHIQRCEDNLKSVYRRYFGWKKVVN